MQKEGAKSQDLAQEFREEKIPVIKPRYSYDAGRRFLLMETRGVILCAQKPFGAMDRRLRSAARSITLVMGLLTVSVRENDMEHSPTPTNRHERDV